MKKGRNAKNAIMSVWQLERRFGRHGNFVIFRGTERDKRGTFIPLIKSSAIMVSNEEHRIMYKMVLLSGKKPYFVVFYCVNDPKNKRRKRPKKSANNSIVKVYI